MTQLMKTIVSDVSLSVSKIELNGKIKKVEPEKKVENGNDENRIFESISMNLDFTKNNQYPVIEFKNKNI